MAATSDSGSKEMGTFFFEMLPHHGKHHHQWALNHANDVKRFKKICNAHIHV
jgi:hypothetical protein